MWKILLIIIENEKDLFNQILTRGNKRGILFYSTNVSQVN